MQRSTGSEYFKGISAPDGLYVEKEIAYDRNGNIVSLGRSSSDPGLTHTLYAYNGNQRVAAAAGDDRSYAYDANGNCTKDGGNRLQIGYNCLNLMQTITDPEGAEKASYTYNSDGTKLSVRNATGYGFDYLGSLIYQRDGSGTHLESALFGGGRLVSALYSAQERPRSVVFSTYKPEYYLTDHLGSPRVVVNWNKEVRTRNDYYPLGGRWSWDGAASTNRWQFNGKESQQDFGLTFLDYGARIYDSGDGRWLTQDPLSEKYYSVSPYAFCGGDPVNRIDPNGMDWYSNSKGQIMWCRSQDQTYIDDFGEEWTSRGTTYWHQRKNGSAIYYTQAINEDGDLILEAHNFSANEMAIFGLYHSETAREAAVDYHIDPSLKNFVKMVAKELGAQWTDPYLLVGAATFTLTRPSITPKINQKGVGPITGHTQHGLMQSIMRNGGKGVHPSAIVDAVKNPQRIIQQTGGRVKYVGKDATVIVNQNGKIITTYGKPRN